MRIGIEQLTLHPRQRGSRRPRPSSALLARTRRFGPIRPLVVRRLAERRFEILLGAETWLAAQACGYHEVFVEVLEDVDDAAARDLVPASGDAGPLDVARDYARLVEAELARGGRGAVTRVASECGVGRTQVAHALRLLELPEPVQDALAAGEITISHARVLLTCSDRNEQCRLASDVVADGLNVRETVERLRQGGDDDARAKSKATGRSPDVVRLERALSEQLGSPVMLDERRGTMTIDYGGHNEVLGGLLERFGFSGG